MRYPAIGVGVIAAVLVAPTACGGGTSAPGAAPQRLAYQPADLSYRFKVTSATGAAAPIQLSANAEGTFRFRSRPDGRLDFLLEAATVAIDGPGMQRRMTGDRSQLVVTDNGTPVLELAPGKASPTGATLDDMFGKPMHSIRIAPTGPDGAAESDDDHPLVKSGLVDFSATSLFALPTFPDRPVAVGERWRVTRMVPHSVRIIQDIPIALDYTLAAIEPCGASRCARLAFRGATPPTEVTDQGRNATVKYTFTGTSLFALDAGAVVRSDFDMAMHLATGGAAFPFGAHYELVRE